MTNEEVKAKNDELVETLKKDIARIKRMQKAAPKMLVALKAALYHLDGEIVPKTRAIVADAIREAEGE